MCAEKVVKVTSAESALLGVGVDVDVLGGVNENALYQDRHKIVHCPIGIDRPSQLRQKLYKKSCAADLPQGLLDAILVNERLNEGRQISVVLATVYAARKVAFAEDAFHIRAAEMKPEGIGGKDAGITVILLGAGGI